jgi:phosphate transport system substrate-binding protein
VTTITRKRFAVVSPLVTLAFVVGACGGSTSPSAKSSLTGTVSADGSSTVFPITEAIGEEFKKENSGVQVVVGSSGTGGGFKKFCNDETDISDASRPIKVDDAEEGVKCKAKGIEYTELQVANDGLAVVVNKDNTFAECLTVAELKKIWEPHSKIKNWKDVRAGFPDQALRLYGPGTDSGTFDFFTKEINGEEDASRTDYTASEDDNTLVQGVAGQKGGLGYFGFAYYSSNTDKLNLVGVDSGSGCVLPSDETVKSNTYKPLSRPLFIYVKKSALSKPVVKAFVDFYLSTVNSLISDVGYTPLSDEQLANEKADFDSAAG